MEAPYEIKYSLDWPIGFRENMISEKTFENVDDVRTTEPAYTKGNVLSL